MTYQASKQAINQASKQSIKQASKKTDFTVDLIWWGSLRLTPIMNSWYYPQNIFNITQNCGISLLWPDPSSRTGVVLLVVKDPT